MPRHPEDFLTGTLEQRVVHSDRDRSVRREQSGDDKIGEGQSERVARPAGVGEHSVCAAVMPHLIQPGAISIPHTVRRRVCAIRPTTNPTKVWNVGAVKHGRNTASRPANEHGAGGAGGIGGALARGRGTGGPRGPSHLPRSKSPPSPAGPPAP